MDREEERMAGTVGRLVFDFPRLIRVQVAQLNATRHQRGLSSVGSRPSNHMRVEESGATPTTNPCPICLINHSFEKSIPFMPTKDNDNANRPYAPTAEC
ncbi:uncharacterized protein PADG_12137 [Paracoccidioides brasiliensis Pb18]|uniref:Uncharacterized protein n=1 Tax=Paracoccidioides brasiliensis (strain Pb18) TaxID=502780 RepID=A0A0A0HRK2_PARBD|nr:uncharacterized protein PADG_12137 [Paracoccidioides brasiliensis Pb18]KGM91819.1 hypothetical protein PADG_12137 [Paracoccidioides brasiliensis Pb18]